MGPVSTWLMVNGPRVWEGALLLAAVGGAALGPGLAARWARHALRRRLRAMGEPADSLAEARVCPAVLEGGIEGDSADGVLLSTGYPDDEDPQRATSHATWSAPRLVLVTTHGRVSLEGGVRVGAGRVVACDPRLASHEEPSFDRVLTLREGDRVRVSGVVEPVAAQGDLHRGYRDGHTRWKMVPGGEGVIPVLAVDPHHPPPTARTRATHALAGVVCAAALLAVGGTAALGRAEAARGPVTITPARAVCEGGGLGWASLASASPFTRRRALDMIRMSLSCKEIRTVDDVLARDLALRVSGVGGARDASGLCIERAAYFEEAGQYRRAAEVFSACGTPLAEREAARLWVALGRYDRASALARGWLRETTSPRDLLADAARWHLLAGDTAAAAAALRRALDLLERGARSGATLDARARLVALLGRVERVAPQDPGAGACEDPRVPPDARTAGEGALARAGYEALRAAWARGDVRATLHGLRELDEPWTARAVVIGMIQRGLRGGEDRARLRAWVETEYRAVGPARGERYDAATARWLAASLGLDAMAEEAREVGRRQCAASRRAADPEVLALAQLASAL